MTYSSWSFSSPPTSSWTGLCASDPDMGAGGVTSSNGDDSDLPNSEYRATSLLTRLCTSCVGISVQ